MFNFIFIHNITKIIYINFHFLPFRQAIKFPIDVYGKLRVIGNSGKLCINGTIKPGMIKVEQLLPIAKENIKRIEKNGKNKIDIEYEFIK